jgi:integrase
MNAALKDLCELCGINEPIRKSKYVNGNRIEEVFPKWKLVGTHAARKTFICYALSIGIPPVMVMRWTGHSDYQSMKPYIDIAAADKAQAMEQFDKTLEPPEDDE